VIRILGQGLVTTAAGLAAGLIAALLLTARYRRCSSK
jgi:biopolymer transport protein ExbB/TolQ